MHSGSRGRGGSNNGGKRGGYGSQGSNSGGPGSKRFRGGMDEDMEEGQFETQLAAMLDEEDEFRDSLGVMEEPEEPVEDIAGDRIKRWKRPDPPQIDPSKESLVFQQLEVDHYIGRPYAGMPGATSGPVPVMRMFGVTKKVI